MNSDQFRYFIRNMRRKQYEKLKIQGIKAPVTGGEQSEARKVPSTSDGDSGR